MKRKKKRSAVTVEHVLIPKHIKLSEKEKKELFEKYNISMKEIPKMRKDDPALLKLNVNAGDIIKIIRKSETSGESIFYRGVVNE